MSIDHGKLLALADKWKALADTPHDVADDYNAGQIWAYAVAQAQLRRALAQPAEAVEGECRCPEHGSWIAADDVNRLTRDIDVALNGEAGAAKQAALCDIAGQVVHESKLRGRPLLNPYSAQNEKCPNNHPDCTYPSGEQLCIRCCRGWPDAAHGAVAYRWIRNGEPVGRWIDGKPSPNEFEAAEHCKQLAEWTVEYAYTHPQAAPTLMSSQDDWTVLDCPHCGKCVTYSKKAASSKDAYRDLTQEVESLRERLGQAAPAQGGES